MLWAKLIKPGAKLLVLIILLKWAHAIFYPMLQLIYHPKLFALLEEQIWNVNEVVLWPFSFNERLKCQPAPAFCTTLVRKLKVAKLTDHHTLTHSLHSCLHKGGEVSCPRTQRRYKQAFNHQSLILFGECINVVSPIIFHKHYILMRSNYIWKLLFKPV